MLRLKDKRVCAYCGTWIEPGDNCHIINHRCLHGLCMWPWIELQEV